MGEHDVNASSTPESIRAFTRAVLDDLRALELLLEQGGLEDHVQRVGVEQEMFLVDDHGRPAPVAPEILNRLSDPRFTTELARFNLEANLPPKPIGGSFLRDMEHELSAVVDMVREAASPRARVLLAGIMPSLQRSDLGLHNMTPEPRYARLNQALTEMRGGAFRIGIRGIDTLDTSHDSVMLEAANTSLQLHLQVAPEDFATRYNLAQLVSAPLLACAVNSPFLLNRKLWKETRVALFQQATDERTPAEQDRGRAARVFFGRRWVEKSVLEVFRESSARFSAVFGPDIAGADADAVHPDRPPPLTALSLHNGTIWRWNRACYGVSKGKAHVRIENRVLPSGPTVIDEVANAAFFYGMMAGLREAYGDVSRQLPFDDARANFIAAARQGLDAKFSWLGGRHVVAKDLILGELLQHARAGLRALEVPPEDVERYLGIIEARTESGQTGAQWALDSLAALEGNGTRQHLLQRLTLAMLENQEDGRPVHRWNVMKASDIPSKLPDSRGTIVRQIMSTDLFTIRPDEALDRAISVMEWNKIRHMPVEDREGNLVGLVAMCSLPPLLIRKRVGDLPLPVSAAMEPPPPTVHPDVSIDDAMSLLMAARGHCLFVTDADRLLGIVTERDFLLAAQRRDGA